MCPTSQVLAIINNPNICKTEEALLHWECSTIQRLWTLRINWGIALQKFCSPRPPFSHGSSFSCPPKALTRMLTRVEGGQRTSHSSLSGNYWEEQLAGSYCPARSPVSFRRAGQVFLSALCHAATRVPGIQTGTLCALWKSRADQSSALRAMPRQPVLAVLVCLFFKLYIRYTNSR